MIFVIRLEKTNAENLQDFTHATVDFEFFLGDGYQQVQKVNQLTNRVFPVFITILLPVGMRMTERCLS